MDSELKRLIEEAREKTDLVELISQSYALDEASGRYWKAVEHDSLVVSEDHWWWNSRGTSGDALDWLTKYRGMKFREALDYLLGRPTTDHATNRATIKPIVPPRNLSLEAEEYHQGMLRSKSTVEFLQHRRNLRVATIIVAKLGWHPTMKGWTIPHWRDGFTDYCAGIKVRVTWEGKARYVAVKGSRFSLYVPPPLPNLDPSTLWIVEGEWKCLQVMQAGGMAVGCPARGFNPKWAEALVSKYGSIFVARDNDLGGLIFLAGVRKAIPHAIPLAPPPNFKGIDDFMIAAGIQDTATLIAEGLKYV